MKNIRIFLDKTVFVEKLTKALKFCSSRFFSSNTFQGIMLKKEKNQIIIYSTNFSFFYLAKIENNQEGEFKIFFDPRKVLEFVSLFNPGNFFIEVTEKSIVFEQEKNKGEFPIYQTDDFPESPNLKNLEKQKIETDFFRKNLPLLLFSASQDNTRPVLTGINFVSKNDVNHIVATDGFRLSLVLIEKEVDFPQVIIPSFFLSEILKTIKEEKEVYFVFNQQEKMLTVFINKEEISTRVIDGEYPPYEKVIPIEKKTAIIVEKNDFLRAVKLISVFARDFSNIIVLKTEKTGLRISPKITDKETNHSIIDSEVKGEEQKIAFNYKFLLDFLNNVSSKRVVIELLRPDAPAVFKEEKNNRFLHIIMPVRIQD